MTSKRTRESSTYYTTKSSPGPETGHHLKLKEETITDNVQHTSMAQWPFESTFDNASRQSVSTKQINQNHKTKTQNANIVQTNTCCKHQSS